MKVAAFTLKGSPQQSVRWKMAASADGFASVGSWAAFALDAYLKARAKAGHPLPLSWSRGRFSVRLEGGELVTVNGHVSPPFFAYRGTRAGHDRYSDHFCLIYQPDGKLIATLRSYAACRALASELAPVLLRGELPAPDPIVERHVRESV